MLKYTLHRILILIPTLIVISLVTFTIIQLPPGDFLSNQIDELKSQGDTAALEKIEFLRRQFGLDKPFIEQYAVWVGIWPGSNGFSGLLQGDWGWSFEYDLPVKDVVGDRLLLSFILNFSVIVIGTSGTAGMIRRLRANLLDELQKQYVTTARAKGMPQFRLLMKYPMRMALNPFIADIGSLLPSVISGSAIVAVVLSLQTSGPMLLDALRSQDQYLAGSFLMFLALLAVIGTFISDLLLAVLDPRIRLTGGAAK